MEFGGWSDKQTVYGDEHLDWWARPRAGGWRARGEEERRRGRAEGEVGVRWRGVGLAGGATEGEGER